MSEGLGCCSPLKHLLGIQGLVDTIITTPKRILKIRWAKYLNRHFSKEDTQMAEKQREDAKRSSHWGNANRNETETLVTHGEGYHQKALLIGTWRHGPVAQSVSCPYGGWKFESLHLCWETPTSGSPGRTEPFGLWGHLHSHAQTHI